MAKQLNVVGLGPGGALDMTRRAYEVVKACDLIVGYTVYVDLLRDEFPEKEMLTTPMRKEVDRCRKALEAATALFEKISQGAITPESYTEDGTVDEDKRPATSPMADDGARPVLGGGIW